MFPAHPPPAATGLQTVVDSFTPRTSCVLTTTTNEYGTLATEVRILRRGKVTQEKHASQPFPLAAPLQRVFEVSLASRRRGVANVLI